MTMIPDNTGGKEWKDNDPAGMLGPHAVDSQIRQALSLCWMLLPDDKRNVQSVKQEIQRIVNRIFEDLEEDEAAFKAN